MPRQRYVSPYQMAYTYTGLGEQDEAMQWRQRAYEERAGEPGIELDGPQLEWEESPQHSVWVE